MGKPAPSASLRRFLHKLCQPVQTSANTFRHIPVVMGDSVRTGSSEAERNGDTLGRDSIILDVEEPWAVESVGLAAFFGTCGHNWNMGYQSSTNPGWWFQSYVYNFQPPLN